MLLDHVRRAGTLGGRRNLFQPSSLLSYRQEMTTESVKSIRSYLKSHEEETSKWRGLLYAVTNNKEDFTMSAAKISKHTLI